MSGWGKSKGAAVRGRSNNRNWKPVAFSALPPQPPPPPPPIELENQYKFVRAWFRDDDTSINKGQYNSLKWKEFDSYKEVDLDGDSS